MASRSTVYFWRTPIYIQVEDTVFALPRTSFVSSTGIFADLYLLPDEGSEEKVQGESEDSPVVLPEQFTKGEFTSLLKVLYPTTETFLSEDESSIKLELSKNDLLGVLKLTTIWRMDKIRNYAIHRLSASHFLEPLEKITLARAHKVVKWFEEGVDTLVTTADELDFTILEPLGWQTATKIFVLREKHAKVKNTPPVTGSSEPSGNFVTGLALKDLLCGHNLCQLLIVNQLLPRPCAGCNVSLTQESLIWSPELVYPSKTKLKRLYQSFALSSSRCVKCHSHPFGDVSFTCHCDAFGGTEVYSGDGDSRVSCSTFVKIDSATIGGRPAAEESPEAKLKQKREELFGDEIATCRYTPAAATLPGPP